MLARSWPPNYDAIRRWRVNELAAYEASPRLLREARQFYARHEIDFICDWCDTWDPRNAGTEKPVRMPFVLFERQRGLIEFFVACRRAQTNGLVEKSRDMGATWCAVCDSVHQFLFSDGAIVGWGSRKAPQVDKIGDMSSIFQKIRAQIMGISPLFWPRGFDESRMAFMKVYSPLNESSIIGECGDDIGRGGRTTMYYKDESAHYEHPESIEGSLSDTTRVQMDISSVNGLGNVFHRKREGGVEWEPGSEVVRGRTNVYVMDWSDHPDKSQAWYDERKSKAQGEGLLHIFAQEVDRDYSSAVEGVIIPAEWVKSAVDAHLKLGLDDSGGWCAALDVADEGGDTNALSKRKGIVLRSLEEWGERDTGATTRRAVLSCAGLGRVMIQYDCIGVGAGVKAESNRLRDEEILPEELEFVQWNAGSGVMHPKFRVVPGDTDSPLNKDFYKNFKAQAWWSVRRRFEITHRAITEPGYTWSEDDIISIDSTIPLLRRLQKELSQPTAKYDTQLRLIVDKAPNGTKSPNLADSFVMNYFPAPSAVQPVFGSY